MTPSHYPKNELIYGMSYEDYDAIPALRAGYLHKIRQSPAHLKAMLESPRKETDALRIGKLAHSAFELGESFLDSILTEPVFAGKTKDGRDSSQSGEARQKKKDWYSALPPSAVVVSADEKAMLHGMLRALKNHGLVKEMMRNAKTEATLIVTDPETKIDLKCRIDSLAEKGYLLDYKTTTDARWESFGRDIFSTHPNSRFYILSAAHYNHCAKIAGLIKRDIFTFIAIEKEAPYGIRTYPMDSGQLDGGDSWRSHLTRVYADCLKTNVWPGYPEAASETVLPPYFMGPGDHT